MLSLIRLAAIAGVLSLSVQGAVVLDVRQLHEAGPGPAVHTSACTHPVTVTSATDHALPTDGSGVPPISTREPPRHGHPQASKRAKVFNPPLFTPIPIGTVSAGSPDVEGSCTTINTNSTSTGGSTLTPGGNGVPGQISFPIFTETIASQKLAPEGASATLTVSTTPAVRTGALRG